MDNINYSDTENKEDIGYITVYVSGFITAHKDDMTIKTWDTKKGLLDVDTTNLTTSELYSKLANGDCHICLQDTIANSKNSLDLDVDFDY